NNWLSHEDVQRLNKKLDDILHSSAPEKDKERQIAALLKSYIELDIKQNTKDFFNRYKDSNNECFSFAFASYNWKDYMTIGILKYSYNGSYYYGHNPLDMNYTVNKYLYEYRGGEYQNNYPAEYPGTLINMGLTTDQIAGLIYKDGNILSNISDRRLIPQQENSIIKTFVYDSKASMADNVHK
ncbi:hypothetical protein, partial [Pectinatus frisingensis]